MSNQETNFAGAADVVGSAPTAVAQKLGEQTRKVVADVQHNATEQMRTGFDNGMQRAADLLKDAADSMSGGEAGKAGAGLYVRQAGDRVRRAAEYLERTDAKQFARDTESLARRQPAAFLGGAFVLGIVAARLFKGSQRPDDSHLTIEAGGHESPEPFPMVGGDAEPVSDRGSERGGWYAPEKPMNSFNETLLGEQS